ncbi:MAG: hypothetical protein K9G44_05305, partial [Melioribacteraceae bacterium]|nr:hypothetical protein [Melioribacteraceae bacterium]
KQLSFRIESFLGNELNCEVVSPIEISEIFIDGKNKTSFSTNLSENKTHRIKFSTKQNLQFTEVILNFKNE